MSHIGKMNSRNRAVSKVLKAAIQNCAATICRNASPNRVTRWANCWAKGPRPALVVRTAASEPMSRPT